MVVIACYHDRVNDVYALVRSLRAATWPRNRHFDAHATPTGAQARRLHRFLRGVERDVRSADSVRVRRSDGGVVTVEMAFGAVRLSRVVTLTPEEHALLVEDADMAARLRPEHG
jgi:pyridoxine 5'-phosphate synthase PdxJ